MKKKTKKTKVATSSIVKEAVVETKVSVEPIVLKTTQPNLCAKCAKPLPTGFVLRPDGKKACSPACAN